MLKIPTFLFNMDDKISKTKCLKSQTKKLHTALNKQPANKHQHSQLLNGGPPTPET